MYIFFYNLAIQFGTMALESIIFSYSLSQSYKSFLTKYNNAETEEKKIKAIQRLLFSILFTLSVFAFIARLVLFR